MKLLKLELQNFRNIEHLALEPHEGINLLHGDNAQGKTNLVEAIYLFTGQKSFRQAKDSELIRFGEQEARLTATFFAQGREQVAELIIGSKKTAMLNELPVTPTELTGRFFAVVFSPGELSLVQDGPALRRSFLDSAISQVMPRYIKTLAAMNRSLFQRNSLLSDMRRVSGMESVLDSWDQSFAKLSYSVMNARRRYVARLAPHTAELYREISGGREQITLAYQSSFSGDWDSLTAREAEAEIERQLRESRAEDIRNSYTTLGPQRDDLELLIDGSSARIYGSQGQQRSCALALKLGECRVLEEVCGEAPLVLLDDVFSELDKGRRDYFTKRISEGQVFITSCGRTGLRGLAAGKKFRISNGTILPSAAPRKKKGQ